jgi:hypothetical protein
MLAVGFTGTTGFLFRERFEKNILLSGIVAFLLLASTFLTIRELVNVVKEWVQRQPQVIQPGPSAELPKPLSPPSRFCRTFNGKQICE